MSEVFIEFIDFIKKNAEKIDYPDKTCVAYRLKNYYILLDLMAYEPEGIVMCVAKKKEGYKEPKVIYVKPSVVKGQSLKFKLKPKFKMKQTNPQILKNLLEKWRRENFELRS